MTAERWQLIKGLFCSALEHEVEERAAFLERACDGDDGLRREVESLLASFEESDSIIETPVAWAAADLFREDQSESLVGQRLGHYQVVSLLGAGGMGEVYLAQDTRLNRRVALKVLSAASISNQEANQRLWREARAAATLEHQHICAIHEIAETNGCCFIVMQYVEGETLAAKLKREKMSMREVLNIAVQVTDALAEAHGAHIIHRDIKPANIIVNDKGQAKVLDFGLAKFAAENLEAKSQVATANPLSKSGAIMGTVPFMSPEQVRGKRLDARTDIFSFGAMLYEMSCGRSPFVRETDAETISAILRDEPSWAELPGELRPIVERSLMKDVGERYQTAKDLLTDLKGLQKRLEMETESTTAEKFGTPRSGGNSSDARTDMQQARPTSSADYLIAELKRHKLGAAVVLGVLLTATITIVARNFLRQPTIERRQIESIAVLPLRSLNPEADDRYLGLGIADSIIAKMSQIGELTVRPTNAVRKYANQEVDALQAARELKVDAVLDSTFLHVGDRLRVSVNLLRVEDGASLWAERFDERFTDIFAIQDQVSQQVAQRLRLKLGPAEQARLTKRYTSNPEAYNYYVKAMYHSNNIGADLKTRPESDLAVDLFKRAIELEPNYALAHAQLGFAYARIAVFQEETPVLIERAKQELGIAERLDPQLAEVHAARYFIAFSQYEGWQLETAIRELRLAQELDPSAGHEELGDLYFHIGLEEQAVKEFEAALKVDPNNDRIKEGYVAQLSQTGRPDEALEASKRFFSRGPDFRYYLEKRMVKEAAPLFDEEREKNPGRDWIESYRLLLLALQGKHWEAEAAVPSILEKTRRNRGYHHLTYDIARVYALGGKSEEALRWLRVTVKEGFPCYPLFARDSYLEKIRKDPAFLQFMAEMKTRWEGYQREFGSLSSS